jgi:hypothetical protein
MLGRQQLIFTRYNDSPERGMTTMHCRKLDPLEHGDVIRLGYESMQTDAGWQEYQHVTVRERRSKKHSSVRSQDPHDEMVPVDITDDRTVYVDDNPDGYSSVHMTVHDASDSARLIGTSASIELLSGTLADMTLYVRAMRKLKIKEEKWKQMDEDERRQWMRDHKSGDHEIHEPASYTIRGKEIDEEGTY